MDVHFSIASLSSSSGSSWIARRSMSRICCFRSPPPLPWPGSVVIAPPIMDGSGCIIMLIRYGLLAEVLVGMGATPLRHRRTMRPGTGGVQLGGGRLTLGRLPPIGVRVLAVQAVQLKGDRTRHHTIIRMAVLS